jgi:hypothetical protein
MDTALVIITLLSVALTCALLVYAARLQREQRARAEARVAALARAIREEQGAPPLLTAGSPPFDRQPRWADEAPRAGTGTDATPVFAEAPIFRTSTDAADETPIAWASERDAPVPVAATTLFEEHIQSPGRTRNARAALVVAAAVAAGCLLGAAYFWKGAPAADLAAAASVAPAPIELVSLEQTRKGTALVVSGTVKNPDGAPLRTGLSAMVFLFDAEGHVVTSAAAPVDVQRLAGGEESPFTVTVPDAGHAARLRVSFRSAAGVAPHVDKRQ